MSDSFLVFARLAAAWLFEVAGLAQAEGAFVGVAGDATLPHVDEVGNPGAGAVGWLASIFNSCS
jgi:uncharacterized membrane protein YphA (DoxX/SURF4 family)